MSTHLATIAYAVGILGLLVLDRDRKAQTSKALWIPVVWLSIASSRMVSQWLAVAGLTTMSMSVASPDQLLEGSPLDRLLLSVLLGLGIVVLVRRGPKVARLLRANAPIIVFFVYCGVSTLWSDYTDVSLKRWIKALGDFVMVILVVTDCDMCSAVKRLLTRTSFLLVPLSVLFIKYYPDLGRVYDPWTWVPSWTGVTLGKNLLGMTCLIFGLGSAWRLLVLYSGRDGGRRAGPLLAHGLLVAMVIWLFRTANSMTSLACFLLAISLMIATSVRAVARRRWLVHLLVASIVCICSSALFFDMGGGVLQTMGRDATLTGRTDIWRLILPLSGNPLLGTGFESFWLGDRLQTTWRLTRIVGLNEAHNGYLEVFLNLGWIGLTLLGVVIGTGYRNVVVAFRRDPDLGKLKLAYFVVGIVYSFTEAGFRMMSPVWIAFLLATVAVSQKVSRVQPEETVSTHSAQMEAASVASWSWGSSANVDDARAKRPVWSDADLAKH